MHEWPPAACPPESTQPIRSATCLDGCGTIEAGAAGAALKDMTKALRPLGGAKRRPGGQEAGAAIKDAIYKAYQRLLRNSWAISEYTGCDKQSTVVRCQAPGLSNQQGTGQTAGAATRGAAGAARKKRRLAEAD